MGLVYLPTWMIDFYGKISINTPVPWMLWVPYIDSPQIPPGVLQSLDDVFQVPLLGIDLRRFGTRWKSLWILGWIRKRRGCKHKWTKLRRNHQKCYQTINQRWDFKKKWSWHLSKHSVCKDKTSEPRKKHLMIFHYTGCFPPYNWVV